MSRIVRVALVPGVLALLPEYAGEQDPIAELRAAALSAAAWLGRDIQVRADDQGERVAEYLLDAVDHDHGHDEPSYLIVGNGSATRTEKAPGYLDPRAAAYDAELGARLRAGRLEADEQLGRELWATVEPINRAGRDLRDEVVQWGPAQVDYDEAPFGVQYWVMRWRCEP